jgi:hypothetical protein
MRDILSRERLLTSSGSILQAPNNKKFTKIHDSFVELLAKERKQPGVQVKKAQPQPRHNRYGPVEQKESTGTFLKRLPI